jgi:hypothetical protein
VRRPWACAALLASALLVPLPGLAAQDASETALAEFVAAARAGTVHYRDPEVARAAGYRPVGPDFPSMGRHWVHPGLILHETLDAAQPAILEYVELGDRLALVGVAYAVLARDARPPEGLPVPVEAWHFHQGTVEEESFLRSHAGVAPLSPGPRIAVLHAWIWLDNPDGLLATDNWALPYARLGYPVPAGAPHEAARAVALAAGDGGRAYVEALLRAVGRASVEETRALTAVVVRHQAAARALLQRDAIPRRRLAELGRCWSALLDDVRATVRPEVWERLKQIH